MSTSSGESRQDVREKQKKSSKDGEQSKAREEKMIKKKECKGKRSEKKKPGQKGEWRVPGTMEGKTERGMTEC